jgi:hypothetical protein
MGKVLGRWLGAMLLLIGLAIGLFWLARLLSDRGLDWAAKVSEVASLVVALIGLLLPAGGKIAEWLRPVAPPSQQEIDSARARLQTALRERWREEKPSPEVYEAAPMRVRFEVTQVAGVMPPGGPDAAASADATATEQRQAGDFDSVLDVFSWHPPYRRIVLGEAGAGKTVLVTELARRLLDPRRSEDLLPVILPAVTWNPGKASLSEWLAQQLATDYAWLPITHARALVADGMVLPILDGLDEMPNSFQPSGIAEINRYGWDRPLVVTSRKDEYCDAVRENRGKGVASATAIGLCPLLPADVKAYLGSTASGRWDRVFSKLDAKHGGPLATVLANPLMLWLASLVYAGKSPDDLADSTLFGSRAAIEHYLLEEFVPAVYTDDVGRRDRRQLHCTVAQAQRWLGFLAGDSRIQYDSLRDMRSGLNPFPFLNRRRAVGFPADGTLAWWQFHPAARGWRLLGMGLRAAVLCAVTAGLLALVLARHGDWRHVAYLGDLFLGGPVGRLIRPTVDRLGTAVAPKTAQDFPQVVFAQFHPAGRPFFNPSLVLIVVGMVVGLFALGAIVKLGQSDIRGPKRLQIQVLPALSKALAGMMLYGTIFVCAVYVISGSVFAVYETSHPSYRPAAVPAVIGSYSAWMSVLAVCLLGLTRIPLSFTTRAEVSGAVGPPELLRLDRQADIAVSLSNRSAFALAIWLYCGLRLAAAYAVFAVTATLVALTLGGQRAFASRSYTDARIWLACRGRLPWRTMRFLDDATSRGVLRQVGAVYQFRHLRMKEQLGDSWQRCMWRFVRKSERGYQWRGHWEVIKDRFRERTGRRQETLAGMREAVDGYLRLFQADPHNIPPGLAESLDGLANRLRWSAGTEQAVGGFRDIVATYRALADADPAAFRPRLADSLGHLAYRLSHTWRGQEELRVTREAVYTYRKLAETEPVKYLPVLAESLDNLAHRLYTDDQEQEALATTSEAGEIRRQLASQRQ